MIEQVLGHDIEFNLEDDAVVLDVVALVRSQNAEGDRSYGLLAASGHTDAIVQMGLIHHAEQVLDRFGWNES